MPSAVWNCTTSPAAADAPIYASIDDKTHHRPVHQQDRAYIQGWQSVIGIERTGIYANAPTISRPSTPGWPGGSGSFDWGTPKGYLHPAAHLHQIPGQRRVGGVEVDVNTILKPRYASGRRSGHGLPARSDHSDRPGGDLGETGIPHGHRAAEPSSSSSRVHRVGVGSHTDSR